MSASAAWDPRGFGDYRRIYPATPDVEGLVRSEATAQFVAAWDRLGPDRGDEADLRDSARHTTFVLVRGLFGGWIPGNFIAPLRALQAAGCRATIAASGSVETVDVNAARIGCEVEAKVHSGHRLILLCHSKGGLDALEMLLRFPALRRRTAAVVLCQAPRDGCPILESVLLGAHEDSLDGPWGRVRESVAREGLALAGARAACLDVTGAAIRECIKRLDTAAFRMPVISVASWSIAPTAWLDSQHGRMQAVRPGCAHDGLFFTESLVWPIGEQILLPCIDHSQPTVGGAGFDHARLWLALARLALERGK
jgi:pimeloyl-ACP methyl ester carboxylesterase